MVAHVWDSMACGCALLTERHPSLFRHVLDGYHVLTYKDVDDCRKKLRVLRHEPEYARAIGNRAMVEIAARHTYADRARVLLGEICNR